jgi:hypothetical protein
MRRLSVSNSFLSVMARSSLLVVVLTYPSYGYGLHSFDSPQTKKPSEVPAPVKDEKIEADENHSEGLRRTFPFDAKYFPIDTFEGEGPLEGSKIQGGLV